ncbi:mitogen-activated protein kinase kinase kinase 7-like [Triticum dicoccoides]|uniref:mitogen-activated protein kinase kinase kinase 7-like n=1 Tax=Triticum dicoccoides TaxID=85692 RepID=UPI00188F4D16|nr:mitogen-activated protein kinase kinase kinase 7-like [Triticum dicoccoides]
MEQLRQVGEALGGIAALMAFHHELRVNPRQCRLLADACELAFDAVAAEVRACLRFDDRLAGRWKPLESPLRELCRAVRDAEHYIRLCFGDLHAGGGSWWARAAALTHGVESVELHLHGLLWCVAVVLEAVEVVAEATAALNPDELARRRVLFARDYDKDLLDPALFRRSRVGRAYLATQELAARMDTAWAEDRWLLSQLLDEMRSRPLSRQEHRIVDLLAAPRGEPHPASALLLGDFHMRRRLGGSLKEVQWMGEAFAVKHYVGVDADDAAVGAEAALLTSVAHPNVAHCRYRFRDEEKREAYLVMDQIMSKDLGSFFKEASSSAKRPRAQLPLVVVVDAMLQIARGMEHLHSKKIYHGELNPSNVLVKTRGGAPDAYLVVKVAGFAGDPAAAAVVSPGRKASHAAAAGANANANASGQNGSVNPCIWYAPEVLENDEPGQAAARRTEKADVYSFGMISFELLTGKIPFEDNHLQGDNMSKNIRAGERPLFPFQAPKYLTGLTRRCWHGDPAQRPAFSTICRVLRYVKRFLVMNPEQHGGQADASTSTPAPPPTPTPAVDYLDIEALLQKKLPAWQRRQGDAAAPRVADVPFEMYAYRVLERERGKAAVLHIGRGSDSGSEANSLCGDEGVHSSATVPDVVVETVPTSSPRAKTWARSPSSKSSGSGSSRLAPSVSSPRKPAGRVAAAKAGSPQKSRSIGVVRQAAPPQQVGALRRTPRIMSDGQLQAAVIPQSRRRVAGGHASDSELG